MNFIYDINFIAAFHRRIFYTFPEFPDTVYTVIGCRVDLDHIQKRPLFNRDTAVAHTAGPLAFTLTIERLCQNPGRRRFAGSSGSAEQVGMSGLPGRDLVFQNLYDMILAYDLIEPIRPEVSVYRRIHCCPPLLR